MIRKYDHAGFLKRKGFSPEILVGIGAVTVYCQAIEFRVERANWDLVAEEVAGRRPSTDGKPISWLIERLKEIGSAWSDDKLRRVIDIWCEAATSAFSCRHSIMHGLPMAFAGPTVVFRKGMTLRGETRKREPTEFHADETTLGLLQNVLHELLKSIISVAAVARGEATFGTAFPQPGIDALRSARSAALEIENLSSAVNSEKY